MKNNKGDDTDYTWEEQIACMRSPEVQEMFGRAIAIVRERQKNPEKIAEVLEFPCVGREP